MFSGSLRLEEGRQFPFDLNLCANKIIFGQTNVLPFKLDLHTQICISSPVSNAMMRNSQTFLKISSQISTQVIVSFKLPKKDLVGFSHYLETEEDIEKIYREAEIPIFRKLK